MQSLAPARGPKSTHIVARALGLLVLAPGAIFALELGEATIKSGLGQSLLVEIPYRLAADERLTPACVGLASPARSAGALPTLTRVSRVAISSTHIEIFDDRSVREPLIGLSIDIHCATAPRFVRSYQLFVDPPARAPVANRMARRVEAAGGQNAFSIDGAAPVATKPLDAPAGVPDDSAVAARGETASAALARTPRADASPRARGRAGGQLAPGQTYRVVRGDTLSGIAARVAGRPATLRQTAEAIFAANPAAFSLGNRDLLEEGRSITIPIMAPATAAPAVLSAPAPPFAAREAESTTGAPLPKTDPAPAQAAVTEPLRAPAAASVAPAAASEVPHVSAAVVAEPNAAPVAAAARPGPALEAPLPAASERSSRWLTGLLALGVVVLVSAPLAFVRRRKQRGAAGGRSNVQPSHPRRPVDPAAGMDVVEGRLEHAPPNDRAAAVGSAKIEPMTGSGATLRIDVDDIARAVGRTDSVDLDVGAPVMMNERVDWFADRAAAAATDDAASGEAAGEGDTVTAQLPDIAAQAAVSPQPPLAPPDRSSRPMDDDRMTLTIVEMEMLRQDYEAQHTLTQQASQELREAIADLKATKAARAATPETPTMELPQQSQDATTSRATNSTRARARLK